MTTKNKASIFVLSGLRRKVEKEMNPPSDISCMNQPIGEAFLAPAGWLVAPAKDFSLFFVRDPKSVMVAPTVFTQLWYCSEEGIPTRLKNTRRLDYESACETWNELLSNDWELVEHQINDFAA